MKPESKKTAAASRWSNGGDSPFDFSHLTEALDSATHTTTRKKILLARTAAPANSGACKKAKRSPFDLSSLSAAISAVDADRCWRQRFLRRRREAIEKVGGGELPETAAELRRWINLLEALDKQIFAVRKPVRNVTEPVETVTEPGICELNTEWTFCP